MNDLNESKMKEKVLKKSNRQATSFLKAVHSYDLFAMPILGFHFNGKRKYTTGIGLFVSITVYSIMMLYLMERFTTLYERKHPLINRTLHQSKFDSSDQYSFGSDEFKFAFAIEGYNDR